ncbi:MAG: hypothetical protein H6Q90_512 [Deltaproteobacteria bacterium]|nr:hypothetical protein [Deltaproteobacteria bacterium]
MANPAQDLGGKLLAQIEPRDGGTWVALAGTVTEIADFTPLTKLRSPLRLDLIGIERINSLGVRSWIHFVRDCELAGLELSFERCSPVMIQQLSMISNFMGTRSRVKSLFVPYLCPMCNAEQLSLLEVAPNGPLMVPPTIPCPKCRATMHLDELEEMYTGLLDGQGPRQRAYSTGSR